MITKQIRVLPRLAIPALFSLPLVGLILMIPKLAFAHVGLHDGVGFGAGVGHPLGGADHVLAMVTVGIWAALTGGRAVWAMPGTFLAAMLVGGILGAARVPTLGVEPMILASIICLGAAAGLAWRPPLAVALAGIAFFGLAHGNAHGAEGSAAYGYAAGFLLSTALLHVVGLVTGLCLVWAGKVSAARMVGGAAGVAGLVVAFG